MKNYEKFYINGEWVDPIDGLNLLDVINPTTCLLYTSDAADE